MGSSTFSFNLTFARRLLGEEDHGAKCVAESIRMRITSAVETRN
jgi:hypothetical protein